MLMLIAYVRNQLFEFMNLIVFTTGSHNILRMTDTPTKLYLLVRAFLEADDDVQD